MRNLKPSEETRQTIAPERGIAARITRIIEQRHRLSGGVRGGLLLAIGTTVFVVAFGVAFVNLPPFQRPIRWELFALSGLLGAPLRLLLLAAEYDASARMMGHPKVALRQGLRVSIFSTAANLLPIPGSAIVRTAALRRLGTPMRGAVISTVTIGLAWIATGALLIGASLLAASAFLFGLVLFLLGGAALGGTYLIVRRMSSSTNAKSLFARIFIIESAFVLLGALRFYLVLSGLRHSPSISQAAALTLSGMVASMTGLFPGGLGIRELAAGAISGLVQLPASVGVIAASIIRLADLAVMAPIAFFLLRRIGDNPPPVPDDAIPVVHSPGDQE